MSVQLSPLPEGLSASVLGPSGDRGGVACLYVVGNQQTNLHVMVLMPVEQTY